MYFPVPKLIELNISKLIYTSLLLVEVEASSNEDSLF